MINQQGCQGALKSLKPVKKEATAGQHLQVIQKGVLDYFVTPEQYDQFFDNVQAGAVPSAFIWRGAIDEKGGRYLRWHTIGKCEIGVPKNIEHTLSLATAREDGQSDEEYLDTRQSITVVVRLTKCVAEYMANFARLNLSFTAEATDSESAQLNILYKQEKLLIGVEQMQNDLAGTAAQAPGDNAKPKLKKGGAQDSGNTVSATGSGDGEAGAEGNATSAPSDDEEPQDELYASAVELVRAKGVGAKVGVPTVQKGIKVGYNRAVRLLEAMEKAGVVGGKTEEGREVLPIEAAPVASKAPATPKCVQEWDGEQWVDNEGKRIEPQPKPPEFKNVRDLKPDGTGGEGLE